MFTAFVSSNEEIAERECEKPNIFYFGQRFILTENPLPFLFSMRLIEVFFNDYGMLEFAVNGLSLYVTTVDNFQQENNWKIYTCDDVIMIIFYPGEPAHLEIPDGDYAGLYEAGGVKMR